MNNYKPRFIHFVSSAQALFAWFDFALFVLRLHFVAPFDSGFALLSLRSVHAQDCVQDYAQAMLTMRSFDFSFRKAKACAQDDEAKHFQILLFYCSLIPQFKTP
ncbi:MAG: hypothetical protein LC662_12975 [Rhodothermaceae bacterium]|nr:hypothetical protein [Rhodothermaceae bacterium]